MKKPLPPPPSAPTRSTAQPFDARLDSVLREPPMTATLSDLPRELFMFGNRDAAGRAGFTRADGAHHEHRSLQAWWPTMQYGILKGRQFSRVTITDSFHYAAHQGGQHHACVEGRRDAEMALRIWPKLWMEL